MDDSLGLEKEESANPRMLSNLISPCGDPADDERTDRD